MNTDLHDLTGAYAGGVLSPPERLHVEAHLDSCPACKRETRELLETTARLGVAAAVAPPLPLRARVLAEAAVTPQLPSLRSPRPQREHPHHRTVSRRSLQVAACLAALALGVSAYSATLDFARRPPIRRSRRCSPRRRSGR